MNRRTHQPCVPASPGGHAQPRLKAAPVALAVRGLLSLLALGALSAHGLANAQSGDGDEVPQPGVSLRSSGMLLETLPEDAKRQAPSFVSGDRIEGQTDGVTAVEGNAELRRHETVIRADRLQLDQRTNEAQAKGNVLINRSGDRFEGPELQMNVETYQGTFTQPTFNLLKNEGKGDASRVDFLDEDHAVAHNARYSTCPRTPGASWMPDWMVRATKIEFDNVNEVGTATNGVLEFKGVPILGWPHFSFPLTDARKSGLLPPTLNIDNISGLEVTLPYYLNIAPNLDATLYPTLMSKRGVDLGAEVRYLQPTYVGQVRGAFMPSDQLRDANRWGYSAQHNQTLTGTDLAFGGSAGLYLNLNRVSDDDYWRDFPRATTSLTTRLLASDVAYSWGKGPWSVSAGAYTWQTLQDIDSPITPPYDRLPSVAVRYGRSDTQVANLSGVDWSVLTEYTRFQSIPSLTRQTNGGRALTVAEISRRFLAPGWFIKPRAQLHATQYSFDMPLANGSRSASRVLPTLSLDSGLIFERDASYFGRGFTQTLEPRAFFTWTPYRDQRLLPNYDSAANDFNLASIYNENVFGGHDRISDTRALTVGVSSRLLDPDSGAEVVRLGVAQRYLFRDQNVFLPNLRGLAGGDPVNERLSDILLAARVQWSPRWLTDTNVQYSPGNRESVRTTLSGRYTPSKFRVLSAAYRLQRGSSEQFDVGWQWPLNDLFGEPARTEVPGRALGPGQWYSVGRINYSVPDRKVVDLVAGFEYDAGCWVGRVVLERLQRSTAVANQRILFQLEFSGFSRLGSNPLKTLKENVPRYQYLREEINPPSRFQQYD
ncbi:LPS-assembly protein LptD [Hydrogenophaga sp.]|uniref:LPS-assembly protein LptD n=1 Tax=Hydrogenophaga sp. TaxID=1904254 RepID=UPI00273074F3|nr:LPS-assembly protein LptD [Hydrogenophaga sp.]MDP2017657.1 LPS-assembly protein LptD [Hydrogenophaga sp.]MDP3165737.1 LPS-assembly protein LptD [Hydrogenophaga sp.]